MKDIYLPDWKIEEWAEMENRNAHGHRLERIADYCMTFADGEARKDLDDMAHILNSINAAHDRRSDGIPVWMLALREIIRTRLRDAILQEFGQDALDRINP